MLAKFEKREYLGNEHVWIGKYRNLHNLPHWHMEIELVFCQEGTADIIIGDSTWHIEPGQFAYIRSGQVHQINADTSSTLTVCLYNENLTSSFTGGYAPKKPIINDTVDAARRLGRIHSEMKKKPLFYEQKSEELLIGIIIDLFRAAGLARITSQELAANRYQLLLNRIDAEYEFISFNEAADFMNLSPAYFSKYFKQQTGMTFSRYLNAVKIEKAIKLMNAEPDTKISEVAGRSGFNTLRSFNREFLQLTGFPPRELPAGYVLNIRAVPTVQGTFDPTLSATELLKE